jgi:hypothetical protein
MTTSNDKSPDTSATPTLEGGHHDEKVEMGKDKARRDSKVSTASHSSDIVVDWEGPDDPENPKKWV